MSAADELRAARALIADRKHWTTGEFARDEHGYDASLYSAGACQWCAQGAMRRVAAHGRAWTYLNRAAELTDPRRPLVVEVNDQFGHKAVLAMFDKAIELAEAE